MNLKKHFSLSQLLNIGMLLVLSFTSCRTNSPEEVTNMPTKIPVFPTSTVLPSASLSPTPLPTFASIPSTSIPLFPLDNFRTVYSLNGNLYIQDNNNLPIQLTNSGKEDLHPSFSDDGEKIVFSRREFGDTNGVNELYSINSDGSHEQVLISKEWLDSLELGVSRSGRSYIPGTHNLLIHTTFCKDEHDIENCARGLFLVDVNTGKIKEFIKPHLISKMLVQISPDGKMVAIASTGHIDIYNLSGDIIYPNIMTYTISTPDELEPILNWLPDSSGLIAALPKNINVGWAFPYYFSYDVWSYKLGEQAVNIPLDDLQPIGIPQCGDTMSLSPDASLLFYSRKSEIYLGHLRDGHTQMIGIGCSDGVFWSPDSRYFIYRDDTLNRYIGSVNGSPPISTDYHYGEFVVWIDSNHYVSIDRSINPEIDSKILVVEIDEGRAFIYESGISLPGGIYSYDFVMLQNQ